MKCLVVLLVSLTVLSAQAEEKIKMYFNNTEIVKIIEIYSKASGQKFVVDAGVRGVISIFNQDPVSLEEAFNQLSTALAVNGYGIVKQGDLMVVRSARNVQRSLTEVSTEKPSLNPERMYTWVYTAKNIPVTNINRNLRILVSKDGEMSVNPDNNQLIISDWTSNLLRVAEVLALTDRKNEPALVKLVEAGRKEEAQRHKEMASKELPGKKMDKPAPPPPEPAH